MADTTTEPAAGQAATLRQRPGVLTRLYTGTGAFDIIGRRRIWYVALGLLVLVCIGSMVFRGFNLGIDFEGGTRIQLPADGARGAITAEQVESVFAETLGQPPVTVQTVGSGDAASILVRSETLSAQEVVAVKEALFDQLQPLRVDGEPSPDVISDSAVSATWGGEITERAGIALAVFLVLVSLFIAIHFERRMAVAALVALVHDVVVTAGVYSLVGFEVTPATVIGLLTILGFSLYDTVVVFDKVQENTRGLLGLSRRTYAEAANLAVNQTLMRSINTSLIAVLPVIGLLVIGVGLLGVGTLKDLALVLMVGIIAGVASSILLATPVLVDLTMRRPEYREQAERVRRRRENLAARRAQEAAEPDQAGEPTTTAGAPAAPHHPQTAMAGAAGAPTGSRRSTAPRQGTGATRSSGKSARPSGKSGRPSGKRWR